jgi:hypothetical protein
MEAFVYCWKNKTNGKRYIGAHRGRPDDGYTHSSRNKEMNEDFDEYPQLWVRQILSLFETYKKSLVWESKLCKKLDVRNNPKFYNYHNGDGNFYRETYIKTESAKEKVRIKTTEYWATEAGLLKRKRLSERNRKTKPQEMIERFKDEGYKRATIANWTAPKKREYKGKVYHGWEDLRIKTGVTIYLYKKYYLKGCDPEPQINKPGPIPK